jgi:hypothetical protein
MYCAATQGNRGGGLLLATERLVLKNQHILDFGNGGIFAFLLLFRFFFCLLGSLRVKRCFSPSLLGYYLCLREQGREICIYLLNPSLP